MRQKLARLGAWAPETGGGLQALAAEALGSFVLVLSVAGAGSATGALAGLTGGSASAGFAAGLTLASLVLLFGTASGAHFNPAVSLGLALAGRFPKPRVLPFAAAQVAGALAAGLALRILLRSTVIGVAGTQMPGLAALLLEALLTAWLVFAYLLMGEKDTPLLQAALALGAAYAGAVLWAGHLSGAVMNPARALGPALAALDFSSLWIYLLGPLSGAWLGAQVWSFWRSLK